MRRVIKLKFGLALSGGGIRGAVHIGILQALIENNLYPDIIAGSSAGSLVGLLYCSGMSPVKMTSLISQYEKSIYFKNTSTHALKFPAGLIKGDYIEIVLRTLTRGKKFDQLFPKLAIVTTDVQTGKGIVFTSKQLIQAATKDYTFSDSANPWEAVRASISIPGIFVPKKIGNNILVDGSLVSHIPVDVLKILGVQKIVGVNLGFEMAKNIDNAPQMILQTISIMGQRLSEKILASYANVVIEPKTGKINFWEINKTKEMINIGKEAVYSNLTALKELLV
jgi:NTE family protein